MGEVAKKANPKLEYIYFCRKLHKSDVFLCFILVLIRRNISYYFTAGS